jgi:hypothetical protein
MFLVVYNKYRLDFFILIVIVHSLAWPARDGLLRGQSTTTRGPSRLRPFLLMEILSAATTPCKTVHRWHVYAPHLTGPNQRAALGGGC